MYVVLIMPPFAFVADVQYRRFTHNGAQTPTEWKNVTATQIDALQMANSIVQHHDAIAGTSTNVTMADYRHILEQGLMQGSLVSLTKEGARVIPKER